jgi:predicted mannosyl-3-phosphoglycerate phosphatase (HAD superfamily)
MAPNPGLVIFSDVDDVLADPANASLAGAISPLARDHVPLILCSGKTRAEIEQIMHALGIRHPFVCEHGEAVFVPRGYFPFDVPNAGDVAGYDVIEFGRSYRTVVQALARAASRTGVAIRGFNDMSVEEVAEERRLTLLTARLSKLRDYGELFRVLDSGAATERLFAALEAARLRCIPGERYHFVGGSADMSLAVNMLCTLYRRAFGTVRFAGVLHSDGDTSMRRVLQERVVVRAPSATAWAYAVATIVWTFRRRSDAETSPAS